MGSCLSHCRSIGGTGNKVSMNTNTRIRRVLTKFAILEGRFQEFEAAKKCAAAKGCDRPVALKDGKALTACRYHLDMQRAAVRKARRAKKANNNKQD